MRRRKFRAEQLTTTTGTLTRVTMCSSVPAAAFLTIVVYLLLQHSYILVNGAPSELLSPRDGLSGRGIVARRRGLPVILSPRSPGSAQRARFDADALIEDADDAIDINKRQFDDYGHMRFGKRGESPIYDDYGHMRFGRTHV